jgi:large subunit ribosomal protein L7/L12
MAQRILLKRVLSTQTRSLLRPNTSSTSSIFIQNKFNNTRAVFQQHRFRSFQSTQPLLDESKAPEAEDGVPDFQNPLHHENPDKQNIMLEDFPDGEAEIVPLPPLDDGSGNVIAAPHLHDLADEIVGMSMMEVKELVDRVADHFGIEEGEEEDFAEAGGAAAEEEVVEEKTAFDLKLTGYDKKSKIKVIKEVRAMTGLGLKEAKEMVEGAPKTLKKDIKMEECEELKAKLEAVGATVEIE